MEKAKPTTKAERRRHVAQMNANFGIEGFKPDADDKELQRRYIDGDATLDDMLKHAVQAATKAGTGQSS